jgi:hypothetical protein
MKNTFLNIDSHLNEEKTKARRETVPDQVTACGERCER